MMTAKEIEEYMEFFRTAEVGDWAENGRRVVEVVDMVGGRFLFYDGGEVAGQSNSEFRAVDFLKGGDI